MESYRILADGTTLPLYQKGLLSCCGSHHVKKEDTAPTLTGFNVCPCGQAMDDREPVVPSGYIQVQDTDMFAPRTAEIQPHAILRLGGRTEIRLPNITGHIGVFNNRWLLNIRPSTEGMLCLVEPDGSVLFHAFVLMHEDTTDFETDVALGPLDKKGIPTEDKIVHVLFFPGHVPSAKFEAIWKMKGDIPICHLSSFWNQIVWCIGLSQALRKRTSMLIRRMAELDTGLVQPTVVNVFYQNGVMYPYRVMMRDGGRPNVIVCDFCMVQFRDHDSWIRMCGRVSKPLPKAKFDQLLIK